MTRRRGVRRRDARARTRLASDPDPLISDLVDRLGWAWSLIDRLNARGPEALRNERTQREVDLIRSIYR